MLTKEEIAQHFPIVERMKATTPEKVAAMVEQKAENLVAIALTRAAGIRFLDQPLNLDTLDGRRARDYRVETQKQDALLNGEAKPLYVMPLDSYTTGLALGLREPEIIAALVGHQTGQEMSVHADEKLTVERRHALHGTKNVAFRQCVCHSVTVAETKMSLPVIVPTQDFIPVGMKASHGQQALNRFVDDHERSHRIDARYVPTLLTTGFIYEPDKQKLKDDATYRTGAVNTLRAEAYADVRGLGIALRTGGPQGLVQDIIDEREQSTDLGHNTTLAVRRFRDAVAEMGVGTFTALDEKQANDFYVGIVESETLDEDELLAALAYSEGAPLPDTLDAAARQRIAFHAPYFNQPEVPEVVDTVPVRPDDATLARLHERAFAVAGVITPESKAVAFGQMLDEHRVQLDANGDDESVTRQMAVLQEAYLYGRTHYIDENLKRGVNILAQNKDDLSALANHRVIHVAMQQKMQAPVSA